MFRVQHFDEGYSEAVRGGIAGITPQAYTRMGVTIRHLCRLLGDVDVRTKLPIMRSDGKQDDFDGYRGEHGINAKRQGIHPLRITIDEAARDYRSTMYGDVTSTVTDHVAKLPLKVADICRRLTTRAKTMSSGRLRRTTRNPPRLAVQVACV